MPGQNEGPLGSTPTPCGASIFRVSNPHDFALSSVSKFSGSNMHDVVIVPIVVNLTGRPAKLPVQGLVKRMLSRGAGRQRVADLPHLDKGGPLLGGLLEGGTLG
jgi:hypothetical protein